MPLYTLFASYKQLENQLTNALAQTLGRDTTTLAVDFAAHFTKQTLDGPRVQVSAQARPREMALWDPDLAETPYPTRPDAWLSDSTRSVAIESKVVPGGADLAQL